MKKLILSTIASLLTLVSTVSLAEDALNGFTFSGNVALTNDYKFYGYSQSNEGFAVQGGFNINHESGFYLGTWASSIDFAYGTTDPATIELDVLGGYAGSFSNGITYDVGGVRYGYPNENDNLFLGGSLEYWEGYATFGYTFAGTYAPTVSVGVNVSPDWFGETGTSVYPRGSLSITLPQEFGLYTKLGYLDVGDINYDYFHYQVGVTKSFAGLAFDLAYAGAEDECDGGTGDFCKGFVFSVSKKF